MQIAQNICSRLLHKHTPTINAMLAINSEHCESLGLLTSLRRYSIYMYLGCSLECNSENKTVSTATVFIR